MTPTLIKSYEASAAIEAFRIVAFSDTAASSKVAKAAANTDPAIGVSGPMGAAQGEMCDVFLDGQAELDIAGTVTAGAPLMSDSAGKGVAAAANAASTRRVIGFALEPGVSGDRIKIRVAPSLLYRA